MIARCRACTLALLVALVLIHNGCQRVSADGAETALEKVKRAGVLKWGADAVGGAPFVYYDPDDPTKVIGFEVDIMTAFAEVMGVKAEMVQHPWASLPDGMTRGNFDVVMNGIEITDERKEQVAFSKPYYQYAQQLTIRKADKAKYKTLDDLEGKPISTLEAAAANDVLKEAGWSDELIKPFDDSSLPYEEVSAGRVEACLQESIIAAFYATPKADLYNIPELFAPGTYGVIVRKGDTDLLAEVNRVLGVLFENGKLAEIYKKWNLWNDHQPELGIKE